MGLCIFFVQNSYFCAQKHQHYETFKVYIYLLAELI